MNEGIILSTLKNFIICEICEGKYKGIFNLFSQIFLNNSKRFVFCFRVSQFFYKKKFKLLSYIFKQYNVKNYSSYISNNCNIGIGVKFPHPTGIVIGEGVSIGKACIIYHQVTIGGKKIGDSSDLNYPTIDDNVVIYAGAKIIGKINIEAKSIIGANSVVNKDVIYEDVVGGVPAKSIKK